MWNYTGYRMMNRLIAIAMVLFLLPSCGQESTEAPAPEQTGESHVVHWDYGPEHGPEHWGELYPDWILCAEGQMQSPIDISNVTGAPTLALRLTFPLADISVSHQEHVLDAIDNGHTIQVNYDAGETLDIGEEQFALLQFHFHSPSEHTLEGEHFPMEMHIVHGHASGKLAVVGVFIEEGEHNAAFDFLWQNLPDTAGETIHLDSVDVDIDDMLPRDWTTYRYHGSLTTPPCSEGVRWFVMVHPIQLSKEQIQAFQAIFMGNNRPVQPLNDRDLFVDADV